MANKTKVFFLKKYNFLIVFIFNKLKFTKIMAENMREP